VRGKDRPGAVACLTAVCPIRPRPVTHGKVSLLMKNPSSSGKPHAIAVEGKGIDKDGKTVSPGGTSRVTVTLKKGTYEFYCPVDGHKNAGMEGKLVVK
jgi:uncharacterized cupredoxin-like copper-binding protein